jgi:CheY-like chemotaxis protein
VSTTPTRLRQLTLLVVEDDALQARLLCECLKRTGLGADVRVAPDGEAALAGLRSGGPSFPDLVILDLHLPGLDGPEVLQAVRADPRLRHIPFVVVSTSSEASDVRRAYECGANCFIAKPRSFAGCVAMAEAVEHFWTRVAILPPPVDAGS